MLIPRRAALALPLSIALIPGQTRAGELSELATPERIEDSPIFNAEGIEARPSHWMGRGLVLNCWATWCAPCVREMPALDRLARTVAGDGIAVIAVSSDRGGVPVVRAFYERTRIRTLDIWMDPRGAAGRSWQVRGLPTTLILDRGGFLRAKIEGEIAWAGSAATAFVKRLTT